MKNRRLPRNLTLHWEYKYHGASYQADDDGHVDPDVAGITSALTAEFTELLPLRGVLEKSAVNMEVIGVP